MQDPVTAAFRQPLPTVEEILRGETQGGVPRPAFLKDDGHDDEDVPRASDDAGRS